MYTGDSKSPTEDLEMTSSEPEVGDDDEADFKMASLGRAANSFRCSTQPWASVDEILVHLRKV